ncbi:hypothetical protein [Nakamurella leprariae]|uniref:DUF3618 domain-containing protein n=1 Tax=Nakamurella leprariae TaxID=2803911 RepID=A0A938YHP9_9ACTN|nr:hypothetical protein [Nakamurella leprariae]MBM9468033.1 hypothetical protein [Nakamurella leprariae]
MTDPRSNPVPDPLLDPVEPPPAGGPVAARSRSGGPSGAGSTAGSTKDVAADQAKQVAGSAKESGQQVAASAKESGQQVAAVAKEQVSAVTAEAGQQLQQLWSQSRAELTDQAGAQQQRVASGLHSLAGQLSSMAEKSDEAGVATDLAHQAADRVRAVAGFLESRDPGGLLEEVRSFARQRPGAFLAIAAGAGLLAGRFLRGATASDDSADSSDRSDGAPVAQSDRAQTPAANAHGIAGLNVARTGALPTVSPSEPPPLAPQPGPLAAEAQDIPPVPESAVGLPTGPRPPREPGTGTR